MKKVLIQEFLGSIGIDLKDVSLGDFDHIGEYTAKKNRDRNSPLYNAVGAYFRPNYERGILIHSLITKYKLTSYLEIGFGRGFSAICAAKAFYDIGSDARVVTIDPNFDEQQVKIMSQVFPREWLSKIDFHKGTSEEVLPTLLAPSSGIGEDGNFKLSHGKTFDLVYIDGDHRYEATKRDWELTKASCNRFVLFDDYHFPSKSEKDIECARAINEIDFQSEGFDEPQVILTDRRIFFDDRRISNEDLDYGQCFVSKKATNNEPW